MRFLRRTRCKIVYRSEYFSGVHARNSRQTFDVMKFKKVRDRLIQEKLIRRQDILVPPRISEQDLQLVHSRKYLKSLNDPVRVGEILNLDYVNPWDNYIYEYFRYVAGGTVQAAEYAAEHPLPVFNLGGGFHHGHSDRAEGFCLINDVAVAVEKLRRRSKIRKVLMIDLDYHQGNGNLLYFKEDEEVFTFSMHASNWAQVSSKRNNVDIEMPGHVHDEKYMKTLIAELPSVFGRFSPDMVFYLAGSDPFAEDTLGDFDISEKGMLERDQYVYRLVRKRKLPLVVLGAGGYGPQSWRIYYNFIKWVILKGK
ncbi:MAG: histone deacetylase [Calditrichia bacterium]